MNPHYKNPAGRLWALLVHCQMWGPRETPILTVLAGYVSLAPDYSAELLDRIAAILRLPQHVRDRITAGDVPADGVPPLQGAVTEAESALTVLSRVDAPILELRDRYTPETLATLKQASVWLNGPLPDRNQAAQGISLEDLHDLARRLSDDAWNDASLGLAVRDVLTEHGAAVMSATGKVVVAGPETVTDELHRLLGHLSVRPDVVAALRESEALSGRIRDLVFALRSFDPANQAHHLNADWIGVSAVTGL